MISKKKRKTELISRPIMVPYCIINEVALVPWIRAAQIRKNRK
jgi:hypothetical protein